MALRPVKWIAALVVVVVAVGAFGVWWYIIRDDAPPKAALPDRGVATASGTSSSGSSGTTSTSPNGTWVVLKGNDTFAGFRIPEHFGSLDHTAVMRSPAVTGGLTVNGTEVSNVTVKVDVTQLDSKDDQPPGIPSIGNRANQIRNDGLETATFPTATFTATGPIALPAEPKAGQVLTVQVPGTLTLHGQSKQVTIPVQARWNGQVIDLTGSLPITLADYGITAPSRPFVSVDPKGTLELQVTLTKG